MRIVAGKHGSRSLKTLSGTITRPTSDKIRGGIFSKIGPYFEDETFLDVFGGSGAMALEALSRGAKSATVFEKNPKAFQVIRENIQQLKEEKNVTLLRGDAFQLIDKLRESFDIVFLDPPYGYEKLIDVVEKIIVTKSVKDDGILIIETDGKQEIPETICEWSCYDVKDYKTTCVYYFKM